MSYSFPEEVFSKLNEEIVDYNQNHVIRFLVDAQLPPSVAELLRLKGYDTIHTLDLPLANATPDKEIRTLAVTEKRILITKDDDFLQSYLILNQPEKLLLIKTGNIRNKDLLSLFENGIEIICRLLSRHSLIEITKEQIITHD